jgi:phage tail P2-like protein
VSVADTLLPINASSLERALEQVTARVSGVPIVVRDALNPDKCEANLLPWLAWAFSVDEWQNGWTDQEKRGVIKSSQAVHKHKGTLGALKRAVAPLGYIIRIVEWYEDVPVGEPYTFRLEVAVNDKGVNEEIYDQFNVLIDTYKNLRSHLRGLTIKAEVEGQIYIGSTMMSGVETTIYPYIVEDLESITGLFAAAHEQTADTVAVYPVI